MRPVREIREGHNGFAANARDIAQHIFDVLHHLQRRQAQHRVEGIVGEHRQSVFQILLDHVDTALHATRYLRIVNLDAVATALLLPLQILEHGAVAATEIEHLRTRRNPVRNKGKVGAQANHLRRDHAASFCAVVLGVISPSCCQILS